MSSGAGGNKQSPYWPGLGGPIFLFLLALFFFWRPLLLLGDGGTCRHFLAGIYLFDNHCLPTSTYMSAVEPASAWTTHELLCDLIFGLPFHWLGLNWVVLTSALAIALAFTWSYQMARLRGCGLLLALSALTLALEASTVHWTARPHVFTNLLFLACYYECFVSQRSLKVRAIILSTLLFFWGNLHGSFPLGLAMILSRAFGDLLLLSSGSKAADQNGQNDQNDRTWTARESAIVFAPALFASCLNLRGAGFITYVVSYLSSPKIHANSDEWRSIDFSFAFPVWSFVILVCLLITFWVYARVKPRLGEFMYMIFLFCASLYAMRLIPYFVLAALPAMAAQAGELGLKENLLNTPILGSILKLDKRVSLSELLLAKMRWLFLGLASVLCLSFLFLPVFKIADFDATRMPVGAVNYMKEHGISGLGFAKDNWGSYLYWRLKNKIFIDDATDFYSQNLLDDYTSIFMTNPGWEKCLAKYPFKFVLIPRGLPLEYMLKGESAAVQLSPAESSQSQASVSRVPNGWKKEYEDNTAVLFTKLGN